MEYVKVIKGAVVETYADELAVRAAHRSTAFGKVLGDLTEFGIYPLAVPASPAKSLTQDLVRQTPVLVKGGWVAGWSVVDADPVEAQRRVKARVPKAVPAAQAIVAAMRAGIWDSITGYLAATGEGGLAAAGEGGRAGPHIADPVERAEADVAFNRTAEWHRDSPFLAAAAIALAITEQQLDDLFTNAAGIIL